MTLRPPTGARYGWFATDFLGFKPKFIQNQGVMQPLAFSEMIIGARVVIGSGKPLSNPTMIDTIYGGGVFIAPKRQYHTQESHSLFWTMESINDTRSQIQAIIRLLASDAIKLQVDPALNRSFGNYPLGRTVYSLEHIVTALKRVAAKSSLHQCDSRISHIDEFTKPQAINK